MKEKILESQQFLQESHVDGWLLYDFRRSNELACRFLELPESKLLTRRFFYWVPAQGQPFKIVSIVEPHVLDHLPGQLITYLSWQEFEAKLKDLLRGKKKVAMEYSPRAAIPYVSRIDGGTLELVRECGVEVVSSADILQKFTSIWDEEQLKSHLFAADLLNKTAEATWKFVGYSLKGKKQISEYDVQQFILNEFTKHDCMTADPPICAVNEHSADPHYAPTKEGSSVIKEGDFILIDLWCKQAFEKAVYADITRVGVATSHPTTKQQEVFELVKRARDAAKLMVKDRFALGKELRGYEVDLLCRKIIVEAGFGEYFKHRMGHNIDQNDHGSGANIDSLETLDLRLLLPGTCFSIEPGIYLPGEFGVRLEYDVYVHLDGRVQVTGGIQDQIECIFIQK